MWLNNFTNSSYVPNSTVDSLIIDRVVTLDITNMGILCLLISILSSFIIYVVMNYIRQHK